MDWIKEHGKALVVALIVLGLMVSSFVPALAGFHDQLLVLAGSLGFGGTAMLDPFMVKKKE